MSEKMFGRFFVFILAVNLLVLAALAFVVYAVLSHFHIV